MPSISDNPRLSNERFAISATAMSVAACGHPWFFTGRDFVVDSDTPGGLQPAEGAKSINAGYLNQGQRI